jgi:hypothetical protein
MDTGGYREYRELILLSRDGEDARVLSLEFDDGLITFIEDSH